MRAESVDLRSRVEQKESEKTRYESKIRALEKLINTNTSYQKPVTNVQHQQPSSQSSFATPSTSSSSSHRNPPTRMTPMIQPPIPPQSASSMSTHNATNGGSSTTSSSQNETPSTGLVNSRVNRLIVDSRSSTVSGPTSSGNSSSGSARSQIGSITNSAAFNRFQTPSKSQANQQASGALSRDGLPVASRKQQRRSKSVETWIDHKPPATPKIGQFFKLI